MSHRVLLLLPVLLWAGLGQASADEPLRGATFDNWLTQGVHHDEADTHALGALGANCVKLPVPFDLLAETRLIVRNQHLARLDDMIANASGSGLKVILSCSEPAQESAFRSDKNARLAFVATWVELAERYSDDPTLTAIIPLESPQQALTDPAMYSDLCSYLAQEIETVRPGLTQYIVPVSGNGPDGAPVLSYAHIGAVCRIPAVASTMERAAILQSARDWSSTNERPVLVDRIAPSVETPHEEWPGLLTSTLSNLTHGEPSLSFVYDTVRSEVEDEPGLALRYPSGGVMALDPTLSSLLSQAFKGAMPPPVGTTP